MQSKQPRRARLTAKQAHQQIQDLGFNVNGWAAKVPGGIFERHVEKATWITALEPPKLSCTWKEAIGVSAGPINVDEEQMCNANKFKISDRKVGEYILVGFVPRYGETKHRNPYTGPSSLNAFGTERPPDKDIIEPDNRAVHRPCPLVVAAKEDEQGNMRLWVLLISWLFDYLAPYTVDGADIFYLPRFRDETPDKSLRAFNWNKLIRAAAGGKEIKKSSKPKGPKSRPLPIQSDITDDEEIPPRKGGKGDGSLKFNHVKVEQHHKSEKANLINDDIKEQLRLPKISIRSTAPAANTKLLHSDVLKSLPLEPKLRWDLARMTTCSWADMKSNPHSMWTGNTTMINNSQELLGLEDLDPKLQLVYDLWFEENMNTSPPSDAKLLHVDVMKLPLHPDLRWSLATMVEEGYIERSSNPHAPKGTKGTGDLISLEGLLARDDINPAMRLLYQIWFEQHPLDNSNDGTERPAKRARIE